MLTLRSFLYISVSLLESKLVTLNNKHQFRHIYPDLLALHLSGTHSLTTGARPPSCLHLDNRLYILSKPTLYHELENRRVIIFSICCTNFGVMALWKWPLTCFRKPLLFIFAELVVGPISCTVSLKQSTRDKKVEKRERSHLCKSLEGNFIFSSKR